MSRDSGRRYRVEAPNTPGSLPRRGAHTRLSGRCAPRSWAPLGKGRQQGEPGDLGFFGMELRPDDGPLSHQRRKHTAVVASPEYRLIGQRGGVIAVHVVEELSAVA